MGIRERLSGNEAVAYAMKQINPDVMGAYPITPSTEIPQYFSTYVDNGEVDTLFIAVESEHSAMSTCIGAEAAGCRAISATSSCGLCYMTEMLYVAASDRLPITLAVSCRAQIKVRSFRPFPSEDICEALKNVKAFAVMDKDDSFNAHCGPMFAEVTASLYAAGISGPKGINYIYGLGGRDVRVESIQHVFAELEKIAATGEVGETYRYLDVRE